MPFLTMWNLGCEDTAPITFSDVTASAMVWSCPKTCRYVWLVQLISYLSALLISHFIWWHYRKSRILWQIYFSDSHVIRLSLNSHFCNATRNTITVLCQSIWLALYLASCLRHGLFKGGVVWEAEGVDQTPLIADVTEEVVGAHKLVAVEGALDPHARTWMRVEDATLTDENGMFVEIPSSRRL